MSAKGSHTTADFIPWDEATNVVRKLYRDGDYMMSMLIGVGIFTGLRISDIKQLKWNHLLNKSGEFTLFEQKTSKRRTIRVNREFKEHVLKCYNAMNVKDDDTFIFLSRKNRVISTQRVNVRLKEIKDKYKVHCKNISCHSLRKTFGRRVFEISGEKAELAIMQLAELFNHSSPTITKRYLGIHQEELLSTYNRLEF